MQCSQQMINFSKDRHGPSATAWLIVATERSRRGIGGAALFQQDFI